MENKINIAEILKDCPQGMELYSPIFGKVYLDKVRRYLAIIVTTDRKQGDSKEEFLYDGRYGMNGECMLFPSKGKTTWEGFVPPCQFKNGDIVTWKDRGSLVAFIYKERKDVAVVKHHFALYTGSLGIVTTGEISLVESEIVFATEKEKQKLFDAIKANGYKWNAETKTLEKLPKFKVGNKIKYKDTILTIIDVQANNYIVEDEPDNFGILMFSQQDKWELMSNKFDINTLKPFDKVLVRDTKEQVWVADLFSHMVKRPLGGYTFACVGHYPNQCIPYKDNEHLLGTNNEPDSFYKIWE